MFVSFTARIHRVYRADGTLAFEFVRVPSRALEYIDEYSIGEFPSIIRLDDVPNEVFVDVSENYAKVTIEL